MSACCAACGGRAGADATPCLYVTHDGREYPHLLCAECSARAARCYRDHRDIAAQVELRLLDAEGTA